MVLYMMGFIIDLVEQRLEESENLNVVKKERNKNPGLLFGMKIEKTRLLKMKELILIRSNKMIFTN